MNRTLTVTQLNDYIAGLMTHDPILRNLALRGEVSNLRVTSSGHAYFVLKDEEAAISCVCFARTLQLLSFVPKDGDRVTAYGYVSVYPRSGQMQFYTQDMERDGLGALFERFEKRKADLQAKGYFDQERKRPIPSHPRCVGIVTSPTGAVLHDIRNVSWRRNPGQRLLLCPAKVQGQEAAGEIVRGIRMLNAIEDVDVIIIGRGGGSLEDLWPFNELEVAEAIYHSEKPVVSAVGHETDFTIADFVADLRAPTPSAAAELTVPSMAHSEMEWESLRRSLVQAMDKQLGDRELSLEFLSQREGMRNPRRRLEENWIRLDRVAEKLLAQIRVFAVDKRRSLSEWETRLRLAGPQAMLERGYVLVQRQDGDLVRRAASLVSGEEITLRFGDGCVQAEVKE